MSNKTRMTMVISIEIDHSIYAANDSTPEQLEAVLNGIGGAVKDTAPKGATVDYKVTVAKIEEQN